MAAELELLNLPFGRQKLVLLIVARDKVTVLWKQHFRKIPGAITAKLKSLKAEYIVVACVKKIPLADISAGQYNHLGITIKDGKPVFNNSIIPLVQVGRYSRVNVEGREIVRKDLPKTTRTWTTEAPSWGSHYQTHTCYHTRPAWQREFFAPKELALTIELLNGDDTQYAFKFSLGAILNTKDGNFLIDLFEALNLLQENVGRVDVFASDASRDDYLKTIYVNWEILPPGQRDETLAKILSRFRKPNPELQRTITERYDLLASLKPAAFVLGESEFRRYFGAKFSESLVAFENLEYGNAIYVMYDDWKTLSKLSRVQLLSSKDKSNFDRIIHKQGWQDELKRVIKEGRRGQGQAGVPA
jgi:hypothetical protein